MNSGKLLPFAARQFSTTVRRQADEIVEGYKTLKANQEIFQREDGRPIHEKLGGLDSMLYKLTMALGVVGVGGSLAAFYQLASGKK